MLHRVLEDEGTAILRKVSNWVAVYIVQRPRKLESLASYTAART